MMPAMSMRLKTLDAAVLALFAAGEPGMWFDNSDLPTLFEDSSGLFPAAVNGLVGLQLDKRLGMNLARRNLVSRTQEFSSSAWLKLGAGASGMVVTDNAALAPDGTMTAATIVEGTGTVQHYLADYGDANGYPVYSGQTYTFSIYVKANGRNFVFLRGHNNTFTVFSSGIIVDLVTGAIHYPTNPAAGGVSSATTTDLGGGVWRITLTSTAIGDNLAGAGGPMVAPAASSAFNGAQGTQHQSYTGDGVSGLIVWGAQIDRGATATDYQVVTTPRGGWVAGNHRYQTTTAFKPILRGTPIGPTLLTNGDYALDGTGWTLAGGTASFAGAGAARKVTLTNVTDRAVMWQSFATTPGRVYRVRVASADNMDSGSINAAQVRVSNVSGFPASWLAAFSTSVLEGWFTATATTTYIALGNGVSTAGLSVSFGGVELRDASTDAVQAPYSLRYDGVDDFLRTESVDFTNTDKITVWAGVRKISDAGPGVVVQLGAESSSGSFNLKAPYSSSVRNMFRSRGTLPDDAIGGINYPAPLTMVMCGQGDIAGDSVSLRINGTLDVASATDQGTGNYQNGIMYFGRLNGTSQPFFGDEFQIIVCGAWRTTHQIADGEVLTAQRTGVTLP